MATFNQNQYCSNTLVTNQNTLATAQQEQTQQQTNNVSLQSRKQVF